LSPEASGSSSAPLGMSPLYSRSPSSSPSRSGSPVPSYHASYLSSAGSSPISDPEDRYNDPPTYSPIETFSEEEEEEPESTLPSTSTNYASSSSKQMNQTGSGGGSFTGNPAKKAKMSPSYITMYQPMYLPPTPVKRSVSTSSTSTKTQAVSEENTQMGLILQILSRLAQSEMPHENLCDLSFVKAIVNYLCRTIGPSKRAGRILLKLSKNLYCLMPFVNQRTMSWLKPEIDSRPTLKDSPCQDCCDLDSLCKELLQNFSLLAETGYAEGVMCHTLVKGNIADKQNVSIGVPLLVRPRKLLVNILINHEGLEVLLDIVQEGMENASFEDAIYSLSILSGHIGVVSPNLALNQQSKSKTCLYQSHKGDKNLSIKVDDGQVIQVNKNVLTGASGVFEAMLAGQFLESNQKEVKIQFTGFQALTSTIHYLYGCRWCDYFKDLSPKVLLELVILTDKYLLTDFNESISHEIVRSCSKVDQVVEIYEASLHKEYPVRGIQDDNLSLSAISFILVGEFDEKVVKTGRAEIFNQLMKSKMAAEFLDDVNRIVRQKLNR